MKKEKNKEEFSFFDHLRNVDEQHGICGKNVIFKSLATHKEKDIAIVAVEKYRDSLYYSSLYIHCPDINFLEHLHAGNRLHKEHLSSYTNYDLIIFTKFKNEPYLCFHKFIRPENYVMLNRIAEEIVSSCGDVMRAVLRVYIDRKREALEYEGSYTFDNLCGEFLRRGTCDAERAISEYIFFEKIQRQKQVSLIDEYSKVMFGSEKGIMFKTF